MANESPDSPVCTTRPGGEVLNDVAGPDRRFRVVLIWIMYVLLGLVLFWHHEAWRDEADSWLMVRDAGFGEFVAYLSHGGVTAPWYVILLPLAKADLSFKAQGFVHLMVASATAWLILRNRRFSIRFRVALVFSYYLAFEYLAISRHYALGVLLLVAVAGIDSTRQDRPVRYGLLLALLANCGVHFLFIALSIGFVLLAEILISNGRLDGAQIKGMLLGMAGGGLAVWQLWPSPDGLHLGVFYTFEPRAVRWAITGALFPETYGLIPHWVGATVFLVILGGLIGSRRALFTFLLGFSGLCYIMVFKVVGGARHYGLVAMLLVFAFWIAGESGEKTKVRRVGNAALEMCLWFSCIVAAIHWQMEISRPFSGSEEMATHIKRISGDEVEIAAHVPETGAAVLAYLGTPRVLWYPAQERWGSYMEWKRVDGNPLSRHGCGFYQNEFDAVACVVNAEHPSMWLLLNSPLENPSTFGYRLEYQTRGDVFRRDDEVYYLYLPAEGGTVRPQEE